VPYSVVTFIDYGLVVLPQKVNVISLWYCTSLVLYECVSELILH